MSKEGVDFNSLGIVFQKRQASAWTLGKKSVSGFYRGVIWQGGTVAHRLQFRRYFCCDILYVCKKLNISHNFYKMFHPSSSLSCVRWPQGQDHRHRPAHQQGGGQGRAVQGQGRPVHLHRREQTSGRWCKEVTSCCSYSKRMFFVYNTGVILIVPAHK